MSESGFEAATEGAMEALRTRADALERQLRESEVQAVVRLREAELKSEALRAGIVDLDGLRLLEPTALSNAAGEPFDAAELITKLRRDKPWLFGSPSSSSAMPPPAAAQVRRRLATEMTVEEWRAARAELLRRR